MPRPKSLSPRTAVANVRLTEKERKQMQREAKEFGFPSLSEYVRFLHKQWTSARKLDAEKAPTNLVRAYPVPRSFLRTRYGEIYHGDSLGLLHHKLKPGSVDLIMTSPPFGLVRKKSYGNEDAHRYVEWFKPFAEGFRRVLNEKGSLVIDIGGAWKPGMPTRSLYHFELLITLCEEFGFHLCQEHYWWNPSKLPTPAEWVNIRRVRVKDAVNCVWWLSPTPFPKANNKRVLAPYSASMEHLLEHGYKAKLRPSGHNISTKFQKNNGGSVPPNLLAIANTESNGKYQTYCKEHGLDAHPARFPAALPEYFIRMLTDPGDVVLDPFAGSCVTGEVCEMLGRRWICSEIDQKFLRGAKGRFEEPPKKRDARNSEPYSIYPPCVLQGDEPERLPLHGGAIRDLDVAETTSRPSRLSANSR